MALTLAACRSEPDPAPALQDYLPATADYPRMAKIDSAIELPGDEANAAPTGDGSGMVASARYRVHLRGPDGGVLKVHLMLFDTAEAASRDYRERHHPQSMALTQPLDAGDEAWIYPSPDKGAQAGLRIGRVRYEISARGASSQLAAYARLAARKAASLEQRRGKDR